MTSDHSTERRARSPARTRLLIFALAMGLVVALTVGLAITGNRDRVDDAAMQRRGPVAPTVLPNREAPAVDERVRTDPSAAPAPTTDTDR